ncbi:MAG: 2Fe-2S iron-sulfur cluster-binding protein, partial [Planctomycetales bacterium]|nr:2Fe-2S iron-sulfur cluster-binding protein [Planctomycetales bacterium]
AGSPERPDPVAEAFVAEDALQCGFCTPGQVMAVRALLARNPRPTRAETLEALEGNLCRCGTYPKILRAVAALSRRRRR